MTSGHINKRGDKWRARYRGPDGKERSKTFGTKREAQAWITAQQSRQMRGEWVDPARGKVAFGEFATAWLGRQVWSKPKSKQGAASLLRSRLMPEWEHIPINKIDYEGITDWIARMSSEVSSSRTRQAVHMLGRILDDAVKGGRLVRNPARGLDLPGLTTTRVVTPMTIDVVEELAGKIGGAYGTLVRLLAYTGMRWAEGIAIRPVDLDFDRARVDVVRTISEVGGKFFTTDTKTHRRRSVPLPATLAPELKTLVQGMAPGDLLFAWGKHPRPPRSSEFFRAAWGRHGWPWIFPTSGCTT